MELTYARCAGLDVHKDTVVACLRVAQEGRIRRETKTFGTMTIDLLGLQQWLVDEEVTPMPKSSARSRSTPQQPRAPGWGCPSLPNSPRQCTTQRRANGPPRLTGCPRMGV